MNGLKIEWGRKTPSAGTNTVSYLLTYTEIPSIVCVPQSSSGAGTIWSNFVFNVNKNNFSFYSSGQDAQSWIVIGY